MSLKTTRAWSVQDLAVVWTCISSSPSAAQTSELGDLRSTSQRDHELRQLLTGIFESTRRNQHAAPLHHCTTLLCRVCLRQRSVDLSLLLLSSLHLQHINVTNSENQNSEWNIMELWWIDELCVFHTTFCAAWCFNLVLRSLINV